MPRDYFIKEICNLNDCRLLYFLIKIVSGQLYFLLLTTFAMYLECTIYELSLSFYLSNTLHLLLEDCPNQMCT